MGPGYEDATGNLRVYIAGLRKKLEADPSQPQLLVTEPGRRLPPPHRLTPYSTSPITVGIQGMSAQPIFALRSGHGTEGRGRGVGEGGELAANICNMCEKAL